MKYFYSIVIDGYSYAEVTGVKYKNEIDFINHKIPEVFNNILNGANDVWDYLEEENYYPDGDSYVALDENNNKINNEESCDITFRKIKLAKMNAQHIEELSSKELTDKIYNDCIKFITDECANKFNNYILRNIVYNKICYYLNDLNVDNNIFNCYRIICDDTNNPSAIIDKNGLVADIFLEYKSQYNPSTVKIHIKI